MATGSVARFDVRRGYGFVIPDDGGEDVFVHQNNIVMEGFRYLKAGEKVSYELEVGEKGMKAVQVQLLDPRPPEPVREPRPPREPSGYRSGPPSRNGNGSAGHDDAEVRRLRRKVERLISLLVEKNVIDPGDMDVIERGFTQVSPDEAYAQRDIASEADEENYA